MAEHEGRKSNLDAQILLRSTFSRFSFRSLRSANARVTKKKRASFLAIFSFFHFPAMILIGIRDFAPSFLRIFGEEIFGKYFNSH